MKDNESQIDKFRRAARELGCDESEDALDSAMDRLDLKPEKKRSDSVKSESPGS